MITQAEDKRLCVYACIGTPGCAQAAADVGQDALKLAPFLPDPMANPVSGPVSGSVTVHVSGCRKGCAHPGVATVTLVAGAAGYGVIPHGRAGDAPMGLVPACDVTGAVLQALPEGGVQNADL